MSTSYHQQTDGQTEIVNRHIEKIIRAYINFRMDNWVQLLPSLEFAFHNATNQAVGQSPFYLNYGFYPATSGLDISTDVLQDSKVPASSDFLLHLQTVMKAAKDHLHEAQEYYSRQANKHRREKEFQISDMVLLSSKHILRDNLSGRPKSKFQPKYVGPYKVLNKVGSVAYRLKIPASSRFHNVFHLSQLKRYVSPLESEFLQSPARPPPIYIDSSEEFEVEHIIAHRHRGRKRTLQFLIRWKGYPDSENTWEPEDNLSNCPQKFQEYWNHCTNVLGKERM